VNAWCLRWTATHSFVRIPVVSQSANLNANSTEGWRISALCVAQRCRKIVVLNTATWMRTAATRSDTTSEPSTTHSPRTDSVTDALWGPGGNSWKTKDYSTTVAIRASARTRA